jgi:hypothetical protein
VHGSVTDEKGALSEGLVTFVPEKGTPGPKISVPVKEGAYEVGADAGLQAGKYAVEVFGLPPGVKAMMNGQPVSHEKSDYREIAAKYNSQSILSTILKEGDNEYSFTVEHQ